MPWKSSGVSIGTGSPRRRSKRAKSNSAQLLAAALLAGCSGASRNTWLDEYFNRRHIAQVELEQQIERRVASLDPDAQDDLVRIGPPAYPFLVRAAAAGDRRAMDVLWASKDPALEGVLTKLFADETVATDIRVSAGRFVAQYGTPASGPALLKVFETDRNSLIRREAARALGVLRDVRAAPVLASHLAFEPPLVALDIIHALGALGQGSAELARRYDSLGEIAGAAERVAILRALGRIGDSIAVGLLTGELRTSRHRFIRLECLAALRSIPGGRVDYALLEALRDEDVFEQAAAALSSRKGVDNLDPGATPEETRRRTYERWKKWLVEH